ncbi:MAG: putative zinc-binding protein, partial [Phycisphaerales bacterium]
TAGLGGRVAKVMKTTESAEKILVIDGCPMNCAKNSLLNAGFNKFSHFQVTDIGLVKGQSPANEENINKAVAKAKELFSA